jgi:cell division protease FtsH
MTAYHEAGHAIVALLHPDVEPLHKVTIVPRGLSLGMTMILPETDKYGLRKRECRGILTLRMAGRVAEEMFCHDISSGAKDDIEGATELARKMVTQWGMSDKLGPVCYSDEEEHVFLGSEITRAKKHGEQISQQIDEEVRSLLHQAHAEATQMLQQRAKQVEAVAEALLQLETLTSDEVQATIDGKTTRELLNQRAVEETKRAEAVQESRQMPEGGTSAGDMPAPEGSPA